MKSLPGWAEKLLRAICPAELYEEIEGDLVELYHYDAKTVGETRARFRLIAGVLRFFRPGILLRNRFSRQNNLSMLPHFLKIFVRTSIRHGSHSFINISGLVIGMTATLLISLYILNERSYDGFHVNKDQLFRVRQDRYRGKELTRQWTAGPWGIGRDLKNNFPEVVRYVSVNRGGNLSVVLANGNVFFEEDKVFYATEDFFKMFSFRLLKGIDSLVLRRPFTMVVSESLAKKYFGNDDPIGKTLTCNGKESYEITGVVKDLPGNTHLKFDALFSYESLLKIIGPAETEDLMTNWMWAGNYTYIQLSPTASRESLEARLPTFVEKKAGAMLRTWGESMAFMLQPVTTIHLDSNFKDELEPNGDRGAINFLGIIAAFILLMAWINYINLTTARSMERAREIGVRKVLGSDRLQLMRQFLFESFTTQVVALLITLAVTGLLLPWFSGFVNRDIEIARLASSRLWLYAAEIFVLGVIVSGLYPAFVMSGFRPINILKGNFRAATGGRYLRRALVSLQFISSVVLMTGIVVVYDQIKFMHNSALGVDTERVLIIQGPKSKDSTYVSRFDTFRESVLAYPGIIKVAVSSDVPGRTVRGSNGGVRLVGQDPALGSSYRIVQANEDYTEAFGMKIVAGRGFSRDFKDHWKNALVNETAMKLLGFADPEKVIGQKIFVWGSTLEVVGVIKDFHQESLKKKVDQLIFICDNEVSDFYSIKINGANSLSETTHQIEARYKAAFPENPFHYFFLDDYFNQQYQADVMFGKVFGLFTVLAMIVACLGLFGLSSYMVYQRTREIGIRKVLGASVRQITVLVSKEFIVIIMLANLIAWPVAYRIMDEWLNGFAYRIHPGTLTFILPAAITLAMAMLTVATQSVRAAKADPVRNLKVE